MTQTQQRPPTARRETFRLGLAEVIKPTTTRQKVLVNTQFAITGALTGWGFMSLANLLIDRL